MLKDEGLSKGKRSAKTKGPEKLSEAGHEAGSTRKIRDAQKRLAAVTVELKAIHDLLGKVESKAKRGKGTKQERKSPAE